MTTENQNQNSQDSSVLTSSTTTNHTSGEKEEKSTGATETPKPDIHWFSGYIEVNYKTIGQKAVCGARGDIQTTEDTREVNCLACRFAIGEMLAKGW